MYDFPGWFTEFKPHQEAIVDRVVDAFDRSRVVVLEAPTGTGKTLIAEAVRQRLSEEHRASFMLEHAVHHPDALADHIRNSPAGHWLAHKTRYLCSTKALQRQFVNDFPYARLLQGRANYPTLYGGGGVTCDDCLWTKQRKSCAWCEVDDDGDPTAILRCPYRAAKEAAIRSPLAVLNTAYWLREVNGVGQMALSQLIVIDEADRLESEVMGFVEVKVARWLRERLANPSPARKTVASAWDTWIRDEVAPEVLAELNRCFETEPKRARRLGQLLHQLMTVRMADGRWVMQEDDKGGVSFKPVWVSSLGHELIWQHQDKFLLMSATVISADVMMRNLGCSDYTYVRGPSVIPRQRRPVVLRPTVDMSRKAVEADSSSWERLALECVRAIQEYPGVRVLVHAVSYKLGAYLAKVLDSAFPRRVVFVRSSSERDTQLARFKELPAGVLVAPAMERGIDLKGDLCRVVIWAKLPKPDLSDAQVKAKLYSGKSGQDWYDVETIRAVVQGAGRGVRGEDDWGVTFILDSQITRLLRERRELWPKWFLDALDQSGGVVAYRDLRTLGVLTERT